jgi:hypothetical protein
MYCCTTRNASICHKIHVDTRQHQGTDSASLRDVQEKHKGVTSANEVLTLPKTPANFLQLQIHSGIIFFKLEAGNSRSLECPVDRAQLIGLHLSGLSTRNTMPPKKNPPFLLRQKADSQRLAISSSMHHSRILTAAI